MGGLRGGLIVAAVGLLFRRSRTWAWLCGALLGGITHTLLDMPVHAEIDPLYPMQGNPFLLWDMATVSLLLLVPSTWLVLQYVQAIGKRLRPKPVSPRPE